MLTPAETRATLYMPTRTSPRMTEEMYQNLLEKNIERYHLNDSFPVQYFYWISNLIQGKWGYSPTLQTDVLSALIQRTPVTAELTLYSLLLFVPFGLISGTLAAKHKNKIADHGFRVSAFIATSLPPFILGILLMVLFYINLHWFAPGPYSSATDMIINSDQFKHITGILSIDGLLNGRADITLDVLRHLAMPAITLSFAQWANMGRLTHASIIEELGQDYVVAARSRGLSERRIIWGHAMRNAIPPIFTNTMLSAATLLTSVFIVEIIFNIQGISVLAIRSMAHIPDAPAALGFAIYSVIIVLILMGILDFVQTFLDPRIRENK